MTDDKKRYALNTRTGRYCEVGSKTYIRAKKGGFIRETEEPKPEPEEPEPQPELPSPEPKPPADDFNSDKLKSKLEKECSNIVNQHVSKFKGITEKQTDALLKKMLYEKLCLDSKSEKKSKKPKKKPKKMKFKIKEPSSSESSQSESSESE